MDRFFTLFRYFAPPNYHEKAGVSSSKAEFIKVKLDYDDGVRVYDVKFYEGDYEYEVEINARTGVVYDYDKDFRWDD